MPALQISGLTKRYGQTRAVDSVDLQVDSRDRLAILGRSGAGKSTLLRLIAGLEKADGGSVAMDGQEVTDRPPGKRGLALVSQDYALYPQLTVKQNLETALSSLALARADRHQRIDEALSWFRIAPLAARLPSQLSGGQAQRVALAKAMVRRPSLLLLDEPLSQIDCLLREELRELIIQAAERYSTSLVIVTHDPLDALRLATRVAIIDDGRIVQFGSPDSVYHSPTCRIAAELLSPFGVNWLQIDSLKGETNSLLEQELIEALSMDQQVGFRPEEARLASNSEDIDLTHTLVMATELARLQKLGFADLAQLKLGENRFNCLIRPGTLQGNPIKLVVPRHCLIVFREPQRLTVEPAQEPA